MRTTKSYGQLFSELRGGEREIKELKEEIRETKSRVMTYLSDLSIKSHTNKLNKMLSEIQSDPVQCKQFEEEWKQAILDAPRLQYQAMIEQHQAKQAAQQQAARNQIRKNGIWPVEY